MKQVGPQQNYDISFICNKYQKLGIDNGIELSQTYISELDPQYLNQTLKQYSSHLINFGESSAEKYLQQSLLSTMAKLKSNDLNKSFLNNRREEKSEISDYYFSFQISEQSQAIFVKKEREQRHDQQIWKEQKEQRSNFFKSQLANNQNNKAEALEARLSKRQRYFLPLQLAMQKRITNLKKVFIEYEAIAHKQSNQSFRYQISAFDVFKVIDENKLLTEFTLKGVQILSFENFLRQLKFVKKHHKIQNDQIWIKNFNPSKSLKLSISAKMSFRISNYQLVLTQIKDFIFFCSLFRSLSDLIVSINLFDWKKINNWKYILEALWKQLKPIKRLTLKLAGQAGRYITNEQMPIFRSIFFAGLAQFTNIYRLQFYTFQFASQIFANDLLVVEQNLRIILECNQIFHLSLVKCFRFPPLPETITLRSIYFQGTSFRKEFGFMSKATAGNKFLRQIKYHEYGDKQQWNINQELFDRLQTLVIYKFRAVYLYDLPLQSPSNIKYLSIDQSSIGNQHCLSLMFPKLFQLECLKLKSVDVGHQLLCLIPSPHVQELSLVYNEVITDEGLQKIDLKWQRLKNIQIWYCEKTTSNFWKLCRFKELRSLKTDYTRKEDIKNEVQLRGIKLE